MPIVWRYLLSHYARVFLLCVASFVAVLFVTRFRDIAVFAASGAPFGEVALFSFYQLPYILPFAIPISCFIAALLLFMRLSETHELTALRATGWGLGPLVSPLLLAGAALALLNFAIVAELAPRTRLLSKQLIYRVASTNPLALFQKESIMKIRDADIDIRSLPTGRHAQDVVVVLKNLANKRLGLLMARELFLEEELLHGKQVTLISTLESNRPFDHLIIENQDEMTTGASHLADFLATSHAEGQDEGMTLRSILAKRKLGREGGRAGSLEIARRCSIALTPFTFTLIGVLFSIQIGRQRSSRRIGYAVALVALMLLCYMTAKSFRHQIPIAIALYALPHCAMLLASLVPWRQVQEAR